MINHRCTRCKEQSDRRSKWQGGVYCDSCLDWIRSSMAFNKPARQRSWWRSVWDTLTDIARSITGAFKPKAAIKDRAQIAKVTYSAQRAKMLHIPPNIASGAPQKR